MLKLTEPNIWVRIKQDRQEFDQLHNSLTALYLAGAIRRFPTGGNSPRGIALSADGKRLLPANYYLKKRRRWEDEEAENIRKYLARQR